MELLIWVKGPPGGEDTPHDYSGPLRGDVVYVAEDGHPWGEHELGLEHYTCALTALKRHHSEHPNGRHAFWRILKLPNCDAGRMRAKLMAREPRADIYQAPSSRRYRGFHVDLDSLPADVREFIDDDSRARPHHTHPISHDEFERRHVKSRIRDRDPTAFGDPNAKSR
jgi:hypothetical protein